MNRKQILDQHTWTPGTCFRHPEQGETTTTVIKLLYPRDSGVLALRACPDCVIAMEDMKRESVRRTNCEREPAE